jgi:tripartite-type tricarboxylate transporter receptor subunit TctC
MLMAASNRRGKTSMKLTRRTLVLGAMAAPLAGQALAQTRPSGIIKIIVSFPPGGTVDPIAFVLL